MSRYDQQFFEYFQILDRKRLSQPLVLGGITGSGGGVGGPPGGFIGQLPQTQVTYDTTEAATNYVPISGSLLDNLNHIRYNIVDLSNTVAAVVASGGGGIGVDEFIKLTDAPNSYAGQAGKYVVVNLSADALEFIDLPASVIAFTDLTDVPSSYVGYSGKLISVNGTENGLIFSDFDVNFSGVSNFIDLLDVPSSYSGEGGKFVVVNVAETELEFIEGDFGISGNKIVLYDSGGAAIAQYDATSAGLTSALAAATSGDLVQLPNINIDCSTTAMIVPAGVTLSGLSKETSILTFTHGTSTFYCIKLGTTGTTSKAVIKDLTINASTVNSGRTSLRAVYSYGGMVRNVNINISCVTDTNISTIYGIGGPLYSEDNKEICSAENVDINITAIGSTSIGYVYGMQYRQSMSGLTNRIIVIRNINVNIINIDTYYSISSGIVGLRYGMYTNTGNNKAILESCNVKVKVDTSASSEADIWYSCYGIQGENTTIKNCSVELIYIGSGSESMNMVYGIDSTEDIITDCTSILSITGIDDFENPDNPPAAISMNYNGEISGCVGIATNTGAATTVGLYCYSYEGYVCNIIGGKFSGDDYDVYIYGTEPIYMSSVQYDSAKVSGEIIYNSGVANIRVGDASNYTNLDSTGHMTMVGNARPWKDELGELIGKKRKGTRITEDLDAGTLLFSDSCQVADDWVITNVQLNHDKDLTASIYPHLHWLQSSSNVPNWMLKYRWQVNGGVTTSDWTSAKYDSQAFVYASGTLNQISIFPAIAVPSGSTISDIVQFRILRDTDNDSGLFSVDPLSGNASALMFDVHFQINSLGSTDEYSK